MSENLTTFLAATKSRLLSRLPPAAQARLLEQAEFLNFPAGHLLMEEGGASDSLYLVRTGEVAICKRGIEIDRQSAGGVLGEIGVLTELPRTASVRCLTAVEVVRFSAPAFLAVADECPELLRALLGELGGKIQTTQGVRLRQESLLRQARDILSRCVSTEVAERVLNQSSPEELLEGHLSEVTILFFDIRGFSKAAERLSPKDLLRAVNAHMEVIINEVIRGEGTVINFLGDAILVVFNCPVTRAFPADDALACYERCREALRPLTEENLGARFELGVGVNFGTVISGAIGSAARFNYTVLGDEVNLAARLESLTRQYPVEIILSGQCFAKLTHPYAERCVRFDRVRVKGREAPVELYTYDAIPERAEFGAAVDLYLAGDFAGAGQQFGRVTHPLAGYLAGRCAELRAGAQPWPGFFTWDVK